MKKKVTEFKSYAHSLGKPRTDWKKVCERFCKLEDPKDDPEWSYYWNLANSWGTCATGELSVNIPRWDIREHKLSGGQPQDDKLKNLGILFTNQFTTGKFRECLDTIAVMELRSDFILATVKYELEIKALNIAKIIEDCKQTIKTQTEKLNDIKKTLTDFQ